MLQQQQQKKEKENERDTFAQYHFELEYKINGITLLSSCAYGESEKRIGHTKKRTWTTKCQQTEMKSSE